MIFINRHEELEILRLNTERIKKGTGEHIAMIGLRRIGKTSCRFKVATPLVETQRPERL